MRMHRIVIFKIREAKVSQVMVRCLPVGPATKAGARVVEATRRDFDEALTNQDLGNHGPLLPVQTSGRGQGCVGNGH